MSPIEHAVHTWLTQVVIGLDLCPFANHPLQNQAVRICVSEAASDADLLADLQLEMQRMEQTPAVQLETTLLVAANHLQNFADYNDFLDAVDWLIEHNDWLGVYQVASFHPHYCFADASPEDQENLTNRAPYPILHILRETSLERAIDSYPNVEQIPNRNIKKMENLQKADIARLFPHLKPSPHDYEAADCRLKG